jgi:hypothetical protein
VTELYRQVPCRVPELGPRHLINGVLVDGVQAFRVLARLDRLVPTNVGLLDSRDHVATDRITLA